jgi:hypothetical protein
MGGNVTNHFHGSFPFLAAGCCYEVLILDPIKYENYFNIEN